MDDPDARVRAAAAEALGLIHAPAYNVPHWYDDVPAIAVDPTIDLRPLLASLRPAWDGVRQASALMIGHPTNPPEPRTLPTDIRDRLQHRMLVGETAEERSAACRSLIRWQDDYHLRCAEWGVFVTDGSGRLTLFQSIIDEIPPFVHRTGQTLADLADRVEGMCVTKPILHFTADRPMAIDVHVLIAGGRPWFAFPEPDDFALAVVPLGGNWVNEAEGQCGKLGPLDRPRWPKLNDPRETYPWLTPTHTRLMGIAEGDARDAIVAVGLCWQSVIVSPERLAWMVPPAVRADPKFAWWERLRRVPCSWVSSRGESDRFLYYDGPTTRTSPVVVTVGRIGLHLRMIPQPPPYASEMQQPRCWVNTTFDPVATPERQAERRGMWLIIAPDLSATGHVVNVPKMPGDWNPSAPPLVGEAAVAAALRGLLTDAGLNGGEADGLVDCWRPQFFRTPGERFVMVMRTSDYDALCPIRVDPPPTEMVRVGLVLTEFGP